ncbi:MAG: sugar transferase, partial [Pseudoruegeria sp.]
TPYGAFLRKYRLDEIPQLWNILKGDMSFVGPRPELPDYVLDNPALFSRVLQSRPGITGLATILYHRQEETVLAKCNTPEETDAAYVRICLPRKAKLDIIYQQNWSFCFDLKLIFGSVGKLVDRGLRKKR